MDAGGSAPLIISTTPPPFLLHGPSTPRPSFAHTPSTPQTSGSSFSQTFGRTPCPANNASALMPDFSGRMDDVVSTSPKHTSSQKARGGKPAASPAPAINGALSSNARRPAAQPSALVQLALQLAPAPKAAPPPKVAPLPQPTVAQPAVQPEAATIQATAPQPAAVSTTKDAAAAAPVWVTNNPAQVFNTPTWSIIVAQRWKTIETLPHLARGAQVWDPAAAAPVWVTNDPAQIFKTPSWSITIAPRWKAVETLTHLAPGAQVWDPAAAAPVSQSNDPAQAFKVPSWSITIAPLWKTVKSLPQLPPGAQVWDPVDSAAVWQINDPAQVLKTPTWPAAVAPRWTKVETLPQLAPGTQVWDAVRSAPAPVWETNDPAQVFKVPSWPIVIVPLWKTVKTLPQLPPGAQVWDIYASTAPAAPQPSGNNSKPVPAAQPVPSELPIPPQPSPPSQPTPSSNPPQPSQPSANHQPTGPSVPIITRAAPKFSLEHSMRSLVGQFASVHISQPETWAWSEPSLFGMYIRDRDKGKNFQAILSHAANTRLPEVDSMDGVDTLEPQKGAQEATIPQSLSGRPAAEATNPSSAVADAMVLEQPSEEMNSQETSSAGPEPVEQPHIPQPSTSETAMNTDVPTASGDSDEAMTTEAPQPTEEGKPAAAQGQFDFSASTFQPASVPQLFAGSNNLFEYAPTAPTRRIPAAARKRGGKPRLLKKPTAGAAASQERPYEVGGDDDPDVDLEFDFGKHFSRTARNAAATLPSPPASTSSGTPPREASPPAEAPPAEASPPAEGSPPAKIPPPSEASAPDDVSPPTPTSSTGPDAQRSAPVPVASFTFSAPALPAGGLDFSGAAPSPNPRGSRKRMRDSASDFKHDREDCHSHKLIAEGRLPLDIWKVKQQHKRMKAIVAELRANPFIMYDEEYAEAMMDEMYYRTLPRLASEILFPLPRWNEADQEDEAKAFVDSMMESELNEPSFDMVQRAYVPTREHRQLNMTVRKCREDLFDVFTRWFEDLIVDEIPDLIHHMTDDEIIPLGELFEEAVAQYFEDHPPEYLA